MPGTTAALAAHDRAGRVVPTRLGVRAVEATAGRPGGSDAALIQAPFAGGAVDLGPLALRVAVEGSGAAARVDTAVRVTAPHALRLESVVLGFRWTPPDAGALRFLRHGWQSWSYTGSRPLDDRGEPPFASGPWLRGLHHALGAPPEDRAGWHESELVTVVGTSPGGSACCLGLLERGLSFGIVYLRREGRDVLLELELRIDAELAPGEARELESAHLALGDEAAGLLEGYALALGRSAGARTSAPFVSGWCSWYHFFHDVGEDDVLRNLDALVAARSELPVDVVQIDDGYQRAVGDWLETNPRFPRGLAPLAEDIRSAGFTPGVWTAPFCAVEASRVFAEHRDWCLRSGGELHRGLVHPAWSPDGAVYVLDPSRDEVTTHLRAVFRQLVEWGFAYLKLDFLYAAAMEADAADPALGRAQRLRRGLEAVRAGAGEEAFLLGCGCPLGAAVGVVDAMRVGPDVAPSWAPDPAARIPGIEETLPSTRSALRAVLARTWMHRRLWINDPDCLLARDEALGDGEARSLAAAVTLAGGSWLFSDDLPALSPPRRALLTGSLAAARRVDALGIPSCSRVPGLLESEFATAIVAASPEGATLAMINALDEPASRSLDAAALGLLPLAGEPAPLLGSPAVQARSDGSLHVALAPHDSACLRTLREVPLAVFCDFDGTFSVQDVGATLARRHAGERRPEVWARYERGEITAWDYNMEILDGLRLRREQVEEFLLGVELDPDARSLVEWCERSGVPFRVLSDGFDSNLNRLQEIHGIRFAYDANHLRYDRGRWRIRAGHPNPDCGCGTGTCKRGRIERFRAGRPGATLVHIGNGRVSDLCGALAADVAFAKDTLATELAERGHPFHPFRTLGDVIPLLEGLLAGGAAAGGIAARRPLA